MQFSCIKSFLYSLSSYKCIMHRVSSRVKHLDAFVKNEMYEGSMHWHSRRITRENSLVAYNDRLNLILDQIVPSEIQRSFDCLSYSCYRVLRELT